MANKKYNEFTAGTPAGTDIILFADPVTGALEKVTIDGLTAGVGLIMRTKITKTFTDFSAAGLTSPAIDSGFTLPAGGLIHDIQINPTIIFSGGSISGYSISIGIVGNNTKWITTKSIGAGSSPTKTVTSASSLHSMSASVSVVLTALSVGANLNTATAGQVDIWIYYSVLS